MEQTGGSHHNTAACSLHSKRLKELENAALQSSLIARMETESGADTGSFPEQQQQQQSVEEQQSNGTSLNHQPAPSQLEADTAAPGESVAKERLEEERTLTDHLNKRLLSSFLEKLNERDLALPGVQRLDCAVADEDSNRAADEW